MHCVGLTAILTGSGTAPAVKRDRTLARVTVRRAGRNDLRQHPEYESLKGASARTGISVWTFREKIASGELRGYRFSEKPGSAIRVKRTDVDALFKPVIPNAVYADRAGAK